MVTVKLKRWDPAWAWLPFHFVSTVFTPNCLSCFQSHSQQGPEALQIMGAQAQCVKNWQKNNVTMLSFHLPHQRTWQCTYQQFEPLNSWVDYSTNQFQALSHRVKELILKSVITPFTWGSLALQTAISLSNSWPFVRVCDYLHMVVLYPPVCPHAGDSMTCYGSLHVNVMDEYTVLLWLHQVFDDTDGVNWLIN